MRSLQFFPWFEQEGLECIATPLVNDDQLLYRYQAGMYSPLHLLQGYWQRVRILMMRHNFDLVWIEKESLPWLPAWLELFLLRGVPYVLDYDDAVFHNYDLHSSALVRKFFGRRIDHLMAGANLVIAGNEYLSNRARKAGAHWVEIIPTVIDLNRYEVKSTISAPSDPLLIIWIGSPSTATYLSMLEAPLTRLSRQFPIRLRIIGAGISDIPGVDVESVAWSEETEVESIKAGDIGVMPLMDSPWEQGKCGYKLIQYMACGLPVVASSVGVNNKIVQPGKNGFLASSNEEWLNALNLLLGNTTLRKEMGAVGRKLVEDEYSIDKVAPTLAAFLISVAARC